MSIYCVAVERPGFFKDGFIRCLHLPFSVVDLFLSVISSLALRLFEHLFVFSFPRVSLAFPSPLLLFLAEIILSNIYHMPVY